MLGKLDDPPANQYLSNRPPPREPGNKGSACHLSLCRAARAGEGGRLLNRSAPNRRSDAGSNPGKELEAASMSCAARTELNTIAERDNIFAGLPFGLVKNDQTGF